MTTRKKLPTLHELRDELRGIAKAIEHDWPITADELRRIGNDLRSHANRDAESIGEEVD